MSKLVPINKSSIVEKKEETEIEFVNVLKTVNGETVELTPEPKLENTNSGTIPPTAQQSDFYGELRQSLSQITYHSNGEMFRLAQITSQLLTKLEQIEKQMIPEKEDIEKYKDRFSPDVYKHLKEIIEQNPEIEKTQWTTGGILSFISKKGAPLLDPNNLSSLTEKELDKLLYKIFPGKSQ